MKSDIEIRPRSVLADVLRGFAVFLVVLGHCIQEGSGLTFRTEQLYWSDELYQFIYSFHMPLFIMLSGFFAWNSIHRAKLIFDKQLRKHGKVQAYKTLLPEWGKRSFALLLPVFFWTLLDQFRGFCINAYHGYPQPDLKTWLLSTGLLLLTNLWFLWVVWFCYTVTLIMHVLFHDNSILYILGFLLFFVTPDGLWLGNAKFLLPFYLIAFYANRTLKRAVSNATKKTVFSGSKNTASDRSIVAVFGSGLVFFALIFFYNETSFIYLSGYKLLEKNIFAQFGIDLFRFVIGLTGCLLVLLLWHLIIGKTRYTFPILQFLGRNSLSIYILSGYFIIFGVQPLADAFRHSYIANLLQAVIVTALCSLITVLLSKIPYLRKVIGKK